MKKRNKSGQVEKGLELPPNDQDDRVYPNIELLVYLPKQFTFDLKGKIAVKIIQMVH